MVNKPVYSIDNDEFIIENYNNAKAFASFLPAIAGLWGKPLWVYYVNRGQAIANFGVKDKDGAIIEFNAANKAWRQTALQGFRTFYKVNGGFYEPFRNLPDLKAKKSPRQCISKPIRCGFLKEMKHQALKPRPLFVLCREKIFPPF